MAHEKELGIIFIINYDVSFEDKEDKQNIKESFTNLKKGIFGYEKYKKNDKTDIYFLTCISGINNDAKSPNTKIFKLLFDDTIDKYIETEPVNFKSVNLGNKDVLSTILIYLTQLINAKKYIVFIHSHSSNFGLFNNSVDASSTATSIVAHNISNTIKNLNPVQLIGKNNFEKLIPNNNENLNLIFKKNLADEVDRVKNDFFSPSNIKMMFNESSTNNTIKEKRLDEFLMKGFNTINTQKFFDNIPIKLENEDFADAKSSFRSSINIEVEKKVNKKNEDEILLDFKQDMLTNSELSLALTRAFSKNIGIIFSAGCHFMNVDSLYSLKDCADYIVGAQSIMPPQAYNYPEIVNSLLEVIEKHSIEKEDYKNVIKLCLKNFNTKYEDSDNEEIRNWLFHTAICSANCEYLDELKQKIDQFVLCCFKNPVSINSIKDVREISTDISNVYNPILPSNLHLIDLKLFIFFLTQLDEINAEIKEISNDIIIILDKIIDEGISYGVPFLKDFFSGISLYFPENFSIAFESSNFVNFYSPTSRLESHFAQDSFWREFIFFYFKYTEKRKA